HMLLFGDYFTEEYGELGNNILRLIPEWERVKIDVTPVPEEVRSEFDIALQQKAMISLVTIRPDIYILDESNFYKLLNQDAYRKLDDLKDIMGDALPPDAEVRGTAEEDTEE